MKKSFKKIFSTALTILLVLCSLCSPVLGAYSTDYPQNVTADNALNSVGATDRLVNNLAPALLGANLHDSLVPTLYSSKTLSDLLVNIYTALGENADMLKLIGIDVSFNAVARGLECYPEVYKALATGKSWENTDFENVSWGVDSRESFAYALGKILSPFNEVLYALLCSQTYKVNAFITLKGNDGYNSAIVPLLNSLKCRTNTDNATFKAQAKEDRATMVQNIATPLLEFIEKVLSAPADTLTDSLPSFGYYVQSGEMDEDMNSLLSPITSNKLVELAVLLKIIDIDLDAGMAQSINTMLSDMGEQNGFKFAQIDFERLSKCGEMTENGYVSQKGKAYVEILRWLADTLKLNGDNLPALMGELGASGVDLSAMGSVTELDTDTLVGTVIGLFNNTPVTGAQPMVYPEITKTTVTFTPNLKAENYDKMLKEIDPLLSDFVKEGGSYGSIKSLLGSALYTNANITALLKTVYGELEKQGLTSILALLGMDISPKGLAKQLTESAYSNAVTALSKADSWQDASLNDLNWGFSSGSRRGFQNALNAVLRPLYPLLRVVLAGEDLVVMDSMIINGADGYNTAIIPILEALGCNERSIKSYTKYKNSADGDGVINNITEPIFDLLDDLFKAPVATLTERLPNIVYFLNSGSLEKCINNLLLPIAANLGELMPKMDLNSLTKIDLNQIFPELLKGTGMNIATFDINKVSGMGEKEQRLSKQTLNGEQVKYSYIKADTHAVLMSVLRILAKTLKMPGNENLLMGSMAGDNPAFSTYSSSISQQFADMSEDELIEWLYNLLFKERAQIEITVDDDYKPTIIFTPEEKDDTALYIACAVVLAAGVVALVYYLNRKKLYV